MLYGLGTIQKQIEYFIFQCVTLQKKHPEGDAKNPA